RSTGRCFTARTCAFGGWSRCWDPSGWSGWSWDHRPLPKIGTCRLPGYGRFWPQAASDGPRQRPDDARRRRLNWARAVQRCASAPAKRMAPAAQGPAGGQAGMKRVVSVSIGSSERDHVAEVELLGQRVRVERIGTDGDVERAIRLIAELDGQVDAFGMGGIDLYV